MRAHRRLLPAILVLVAMTFSLAETVWASTCAPAMAPTIAAEASDAERHADCSSGMTDATGGEPHERDDTHCPFDPAAPAQGCIAIASLPARAAEAPAPWSAPSVTSFAEQKQQDHLSASTPFHPPRP
jgi:hypothetical protein